MKQAYLYNKGVRYYSRTLRKLQILILEGKNLRRQDILQRRIVRMFKTLTGLQRLLKIGMATAALSAGMLLFQPNTAQAQTITFGAKVINPFGLTEISGGTDVPSPALVDLDADGDMDLMSGEFDGNFLFFENTGTATVPSFAPFLANPFNQPGSYR